MIFVEQASPTEFSVQFIPTDENLERIRQIPYARFNGEKSWIVPIQYLNQFEHLFYGEFIYVTPRHVMTGEPAPPVPKMYEKIPKHPVTRIKAPWKLYDYQAFGANFLACIAGGTGHAFLTDSVGTGKTLQSIAGAHILQDQGKVDNVLVFCKASLKHQWLRDGVHKFTEDDGIVIDGTKKKRTKQYEEALDPKYRYIFVNYELLLHDFELLSSVIVEKDIRLIIADEAHKVSSPKGKMNNALKKLVQPDKKKKYPGVEHIFYLTATPLSSKVEQLYGLFSIRRPDHFGKFSGFSKRYMKFQYQKGRAPRQVGVKNMNELEANIWKFMLRRTSNEIDMELPEKVELFREVEFTPLQKKLDKMAIEDRDKHESQLKKMDPSITPKEQMEAKEGMVKAMVYVRKAISDDPKLLTMSKSHAIREKYGSLVRESRDRDKVPKWEELKDIIEEVVIQGREKMVIFTELETMTRILQTKIHAMGLKCVTYSGKMNTEEKDAAAMAFREDPECRIFLGTDSAAEGLNLQFAPVLVNYDLPWLPDTYTQRNGRIQRGGSAFKSIRIINLMSSEGIDPSVWESIERKLKTFNFFVENTEERSQAIKEAMK